MKRLPMTERHFQKLEEYGLLGVARDACSCLLFEPGETLLVEGDPIGWYGVVINGRAKVCRAAPDGRTLILCNYMSDGMIGEIELLTNRQTATTTVTAISDFECVAVRYEACRAELKENAAFLYKLGSVLAEKLVQSADGFSSSVLCSGTQRLCAYILQTSNHGVFSDVLTDVSCSVGLSYRHMFRLLGKLCADGILEKRETGYRILDRSKLARLSK